MSRLDTSMPNIMTGRILPIILFPTLTALAFNLLFGRLKAAGLAEQLGPHCIPTAKFTPQPYTGVYAIDQSLCPLVTFFGILMRFPTGLSFLTYALGIGAPLILLPTFEAYRTGQNTTLKYPVVWLLLSQVMSVGATIPLYWLTFILTGGVQRSRKSAARSVTQAEAEALVFGIIVGAIFPSVAMLMLDDPTVTAMWQPYPAYIAIAASLHIIFRPSSKHPQSGFTTLQVLFIGCFLISSSVHISTVWPLLNDLDGLRALFLPSLSLLDSKTDISTHLLDFLKWDVIIAYLSTALATLWLAENAKQAAIFVLWYALAIPAFGFGAAVMGVILWSNGLLS